MPAYSFPRGSISHSMEIEEEEKKKTTMVFKLISHMTNTVCGLVVKRKEKSKTLGLLILPKTDD